MKNKLALKVFAATLAIQSLQAIPVTITFDNLYSTPGYRANYSEQGYVFTSSLNSQYALGSWGATSSSFAGSTALYNNYYIQKTALTRADGGLFNIYSLDLSELLKDGKAGTVTFTGYQNGDAKVTQSFTMDGTFGFQTLLLAGFNNLKTLEWTTGGLSAPAGVSTATYMSQFDNLFVDTSDGAIPPAFTPGGTPLSVPDGGATLALMGLGLAGICLIGVQFKGETAQAKVRR